MKCRAYLGMMGVWAWAIGLPAMAQETAAPVAGAGQRMTVMMMIQQGGVITWLIMALGFFTFTWAIYLLATITPRREAPAQLAKRVQTAIRAGDIKGALQMCHDRDELLANVLRAGLKMAGHERYVIQDAMESEGERGSTALWQRISYLNSAATLAPLLGLLGTVWGMMLAFGSIAFDTAQVKMLNMASSVALAMITTAAGLLLAIPAMAVYFYLRGRVIKIIANVEAHASEFIELITRSKPE